MLNFITPSNVVGLPDEDYSKLNRLCRVLLQHQVKNNEKNVYYEGKISLNRVNLGIALPEGLRGLEIGCAWGAKCVDVLAARSMFDGFVGENGDTLPELDALVQNNRLIEGYQRACRDELKLGATFATLSRDPKIGCKIRFHSAQTAAGLWNGDKGRLDCGLAIIDSAPDNVDALNWSPSLVYFYTDTTVWVLRRWMNIWTATGFPHRMGRPLMEPLIWNATSDKPFGRSRIKEPIRRLIDGYVRTVANATIGLEFSTAPQKYLMGVTDKQFDAVVNDKFRQYVGSIIAGTTHPDTGEKPSFGQLPQGSIQPHVDMLRMLATQFSAATGLTVTDTGVVNDANPSSSDAIEAQTKTLVALAEQLNTGNGDSLRTIARMALAISHDTNLEGLSPEQSDIVAHFRSPAMPSVAATADAATKIAAARQGFAQTDVFLQMVGFDPADIRRIKAQEQRARGLQVLSELEAE